MTQSDSIAKEKSWQALIAYAIVIAAIAISAAHILNDSGIVPAPPMDQHFVETSNLRLGRSGGHWAFHYPNLQNAGGISSSVAAGIYKLIIPTTHETLNWHFRIFSMTGLLISSFYLFKTAIPAHWGLRTAAFLIIATSGYQLLQPSSDVITATFLNLFLLAVLRCWPRTTAALFLTLFGLGKVELSLGAIAIAFLWYGYERRQGREKSYLVIAQTALWFFIFLLPAFVLEGSNPLQGSRSTVAFFSAYSGFMRFHQFLGSTPTTDEAMQATTGIVFPDCNSLIDVIRKHPRIYFDYIGVSATRSIPNITSVFKFMLAPVTLVAINWRQASRNRFLLLSAAVAAICILLPSWLVIFVRMRYIAKVLPAITAATMAGTVEISRINRLALPLTWSCALLTIAWQIMALSPYQD